MEIDLARAREMVAVLVAVAVAVVVAVVVDYSPPRPSLLPHDDPEME